MYTQVKTDSEIEAIRESGRMLAAVLDAVEKWVDIGASGIEINEKAAQELKALGGEPAFKGYLGFPGVICISYNDEVVHGLPRDIVLQDGDILSLDFGVKYNGMITDSARTLLMGNTEPAVVRLVEETQRAMHAGIDVVKDGVRTGDIGAAVQRVLNEGDYGIVTDLVGHGVGHEVHEEPNVPNFGVMGKGDMLKAGMTIAIEPMATLGSKDVVVNSDGWTIRTKDGSMAAHWEHTVLITPDGYEILT